VRIKIRVEGGAGHTAMRMIVRKIKKMFHKGPVAANGACQKWHILFLDIFQQNLAHL
jgi:hypothetical protein